jgi:hypothetical protein
MNVNTYVYMSKYIFKILLDVLFSRHIFTLILIKSNQYTQYHIDYNKNDYYII